MHIRVNVHQIILQKHYFLIIKVYLCKLLITILAFILNTSYILFYLIKHIIANLNRLFYFLNLNLKFFTILFSLSIYY